MTNNLKPFVHEKHERHEIKRPAAQGQPCIPHCALAYSKVFSGFCSCFFVPFVDMLFFKLR